MITIGAMIKLLDAEYSPFSPNKLYLKRFNSWQPKILEPCL